MIGTLRGLITAMLLLSFVLLMIRLFSPKRRTEFDLLARVALEDDSLETHHEK